MNQMTRNDHKKTGISINLEGYVNTLLCNILDQWIYPAPFANPALLWMFKDRNSRPYRDLERWSGEFIGKYLNTCVAFYSFGKPNRLKAHIEWLIDRLIMMQADNGYLGPWQDAYALRGFEQTNMETWDTWGHYLLMFALSKWYEETSCKKALTCACKIADLLCDTFLNKKRLVDIGVPKVNLAPIHALCILHRITGEPRYLALARQIEIELETPPAGMYPAGDYIRQALAGKAYYETNEPRWEGLHTVQGIAELYRITDDEKYRKAFEQLWWSIVKTDRHNSGAFSTNEKAVGSPFMEGTIETCCTVAWMALTVDQMKLSADSIAADEWELSFFNAGLGALSPSGRWCTYDTPRNGVRRASAHDIVFQAREGASELNCCSVNGPYALGLLRDYAVIADENRMYVHFYGASRIDVPFGTDHRVTLVQTTDYPRTGSIHISVNPLCDVKFTLCLRIPHWSSRTAVAVNGQPISNVIPGSYCTIDRLWRKGDIVTIALDMRLHFWRGKDLFEGKSSIYRGPILLTYDRKNNSIEPGHSLWFDANTMQAGERIETDRMRDETCNAYDNWMKPWMLFSYQACDGQRINLCDFATAGEGGTYYESWLPVKNTKYVPFSRSNPLCSRQPDHQPE